MSASPQRRATRGLHHGELARTVRLHRAWLIAGLVAAAVAAGLTAVSPPPAPRASVVVAARDLAAGALLGRNDVAVARLPPAAVPDRALRRAEQAAGRRVAGPVRRGEPLTDVRLIGPGLLAGLPRGQPADAGSFAGSDGGGWVAVPVRLTDAGAASVVVPGDHIDVIATPTDGAGPATVVAPDVLVVATMLAGATGSLDGSDVGSAGGSLSGSVGGAVTDIGDGGLIVVATTPPVAAALARAAVGEQLSPAVLAADQPRR